MNPRDLDLDLPTAVLATLPQAVVAIGATGEITAWSPAATRLFGWSDAQAVGRPLSEVLVPPEFRDAHRRGLARYRDTGESRVCGRPLAFMALRQDGTRIPVLVTIHDDGDGRFHAFLQAPADSPPGRRREETALRQVERVLPGVLVRLRVDDEGGCACEPLSAVGAVRLEQYLGTGALEGLDLADLLGPGPDGDDLCALLTAASTDLRPVRLSLPLAASPHRRTDLHLAPRREDGLVVWEGVWLWSGSPG